MVTAIKSRVFDYFSKGHERTLKARKNVVLSLFYRGATVAIGLILVPLTINYINQTQYGIWITLSSVISWFSFFDIGLGNGLKNKLAESNALQKYDQSVIYISTIYAALAVISASLFILFLIANQFIDWQSILNSQNGDLNRLAILVFGFFCLQFVFQIINTVLAAFHATAKVSLLNLIAQVFCVAIIFILTKTHTSSLLYLAIAMAGSRVAVQLFAGVWFFNNDYKKFAPRLSAVKFSYMRSLLSTGGVFFILQIGALILYQTDNILITQLFGPADVTVFSVAYKLFNTFSLVFNIFLSPMWTAYTDAYTKGDFEWMKQNLNKTRKILLLLSCASLVVFVLSPYIFKIWLHGKISVPFSVSLSLFISTIMYNWLDMHCIMLNGLHKVRIQVYLYLFCFVVNIPLAIFLAKYFGIAGVTLSNIFIYIIMGWILAIQCDKILNKNALGLWNK